MKIHQTLLLSLAALALTACPGGSDVAPRDDATTELPGQNTDQAPNQDNQTSKDDSKDDANWRDDHGVPPELMQTVRERNSTGDATHKGVVLLDLAKQNEVGRIEEGEFEGKVLAGEWSSAKIVSIEGDVFGYETPKIDPDKPWFQSKVFYSGKAVIPYGDEVGDLMYYIDFGTRKGNGSISGLSEVSDIKNVDTVVLEEVEFDDHVAWGKAHMKMKPEARGWGGADEAIAGSDQSQETVYKDGVHPMELRYIVKMYGLKADEVAGKIEHQEADQVIFQGTRWNDPTTAP